MLGITLAILEIVSFNLLNVLNCFKNIKLNGREGCGRGQIDIFENAKKKVYALIWYSKRYSALMRP